MRSIKPDAALVVFTYHSKEEIIEKGGSEAWVLNPARAANCEYLVCTRNRHYFRAAPHLQPETPERHGAAFLVGRITTVDRSPDWPGRYIVRFEKCAFLDPQPIVWRGTQNPVWYVDDISQLGIEPARLDWRVVVNAATSGELRRKLAKVRVPPRGHGQGRARKRLSETRIAYRFLAAVSDTGMLAFPLCIRTGERPDVVLKMPSAQSVGIEITEAVPRNEARIDAHVRDEEIEGARHILPHRVKDPALTREEIGRAAKGQTRSLPQMGDSIEINWVEAIIERIKRKTETFGKKGFRKYPDNWLLIYDNWSPHPLPDDDVRTEWLGPQVSNLMKDIPFSRIFVQDECAIWEFARGMGVRQHRLMAD